MRVTSRCESCSLFDRCARSKTIGRNVTMHAHESNLQEACVRSQTATFKELCRLCCAVECKIAELAIHDLRDTRYQGNRKRQFQRLWTGAVVNLKRLFNLAKAQNVDLLSTLAGLAPPLEEKVHVYC